MRRKLWEVLFCLGIFALFASAMVRRRHAFLVFVPQLLGNPSSVGSGPDSTPAPRPLIKDTQVFPALGTSRGSGDAVITPAGTTTNFWLKQNGRWWCLHSSVWSLPAAATCPLISGNFRLSRSQDLPSQFPIFAARAAKYLVMLAAQERAGICETFCQCCW